MSSEDGDEKSQKGTAVATRDRGAVPRLSDEFQTTDGELVADEQEVEIEEGGQHATGRSRNLSVKLSQHSGPLPSPDTFRKYNEVLPGAADRILKMAENEGEHRRNLELTVVRAEIATQKRGQMFGFSAYAAALGLGAYLLYLGIPGLGIAAVITALGTMLATSLWSRYEDRKQRKLEEAKIEAAKAAAAKAEAAAKKS